MPHLRIIIAFAAAVCATADAAATSAEFSTGHAVTATPTTEVTRTDGRSDIECAVKCTAATRSSCSASAFDPETQTCLLSKTREADLAAVAGGNAAYRLSKLDFKNIQVQLGARRFHVIQQQSNGNVNFQRNCVEYENGFGDETDFWIDSSTNYTMTFDSRLSASCSMTHMTAQTLQYHKGMQFSTMDVDNDNLAPNLLAATEAGGTKIACTPTLTGFISTQQCLTLREPCTGVALTAQKQ